MRYRLQDIARALSLEAKGDAEINSVAAIEDAKSDQIAFINKKSYLKHLPNCNAAAVILKEEWQAACSLPCLITDDPYYTYAQVCHLLYPDEYTKVPDIAKNAVVAVTAKIGNSVVISPNAVIGEGVTIGDNTYIASGVIIQQNAIIGSDVRLHANVVIEHDCVIGNRVICHAGAVIGSDGFGLAPKNGKWLKIPQVGRVIIGDDVEVGANTVIDRGANRDTIIEEGVKLDNLIQIAHNVRIGAHTAIAGTTAIAGSTSIGKYCTIGGAASIVGHLTIVDHTHIHAKSMVTNDITEPGQYASGTPLEPVKQWRKNCIRIKQLDEMARKLNELTKK